jgi:hypothetical protein
MLYISNGYTDYKNQPWEFNFVDFPDGVRDYKPVEPEGFYMNTTTFNTMLSELGITKEALKNLYNNLEIYFCNGEYHYVDYIFNYFRRDLYLLFPELYERVVINLRSSDRIPIKFYKNGVLIKTTVTNRGNDTVTFKLYGDSTYIENYTVNMKFCFTEYIFKCFGVFGEDSSYDFVEIGEQST